MCFQLNLEIISFSQTQVANQKKNKVSLPLTVIYTPIHSKTKKSEATS